MPQKIQFRFYLLTVLILLTQARTFALGVDDFQARTFKDASGKTVNYRLFIPKTYKPGEKYPLILFLHGSGERGSDNQKQVGYFGASVFADDFTQATHPCFLVAPQCPEGDSWAAIRYTQQDGELAPSQTEPMRLTLAALDALQKEFSIDSNRLYITGLSMGGYGTWDALARHPGLFAAAVPICGGGAPATAKKFANTPLWDFHGGADPVVPPARSHHMVIALREAGGQPIFTEYPGVGHNSWERAYREARLADWLFTKRLPLPPLPKTTLQKPRLAGKKSYADAGLVAVWRANEHNDKAIRDFSRNHNDIPLQNGQMVIQENNVLNFNDTTPLLTFEPKADSRLDKAFTLAAWFRADAGHYEPETLFLFPSDDEKNSCVIGLDETHRLKFVVSTPSGFSFGAVICAPGWHHVAITCVGDKIAQYLDGVPAGDNEGTNGAAQRGLSNRALFGGDAQGKNLFFGKMNDIRIYNRALTRLEIAILAGATPNSGR